MSATGSKKTASARAAALLPRGGRHALTQEAVASSQHQRMLIAVATAVKQSGYAATTVAHVIALAGVSRRTFYEQFEGIEACFLAAYEAGAMRLLTAIAVALADLPAADWKQRSEIAIAAYLRELASEPDAAWVYSVDVMGAGCGALAKRAWVLEQWIAQWRAVLALRNDDSNAVLTEPTMLALVGGLEELVRDGLRRRGAKRLPDIAPQMMQFALRVIGA